MFITIAGESLSMLAIGANKLVPIGKPVDNMKAYILDSDLALLPPGLPGELCLSGVGIAEGYLNSEHLSKEKFVQNPYGQAVYDRLYKTGDIARCSDDGLLYNMIPSHFIEIRSFPMTSSDEVDRKSLEARAIVVEAKALVSKRDLPVTNNEKVIYEVWSDTLGNTTYSVHGNFFHLGGDSFIMMRILVLLR
jgi:hypothetical protein